MPVIPAFRVLRQKNLKFEASLGCIIRTCLTEIRRIMVQASPGKMFSRPPSQPMAGCGGTHLSPQLHRVVQIEGLNLRHKASPYSINNSRKKGWQCGSSGRAPA
jgi:hypothetical protein